MRRAVVVAIVGFGAAAACGDNTFVGQDDASTNDSGASDASDAAVDVLQDAEAGDAGNDSAVLVIPGNVLEDPSFESDASSGCGFFWLAAGPSTEISLAPVPHSGLQSCLVCVSSGGYGELLTNNGVETLAALDAGFYEASAWIKTVSLEAGAASPIAQSILYSPGSGNLYGPQTDISGGGWKKVYLDLSLQTDTFHEPGVFLYPDSDSGTGCAYVDDVALVAQ